MTQALYAYMNNKTIKIKKKKEQFVQAGFKPDPLDLCLLSS
jgi:hypothetical protein